MPAAISTGTAVEQALKERAEIAREEAAAESFRQQGQLARAEGLPDIAPQLRAGSLTRGPRDAGIGIGITLPLIDYGSRRNRIEQMQQAARAQADRVTAARNLVRQEVEQAIVRFNAARSVLESYQQGIVQQSRRLLEASRIGFQEGQTSLVAVLEAQRTYRSVQTEYANALANLAEAQAELERATGAIPASLLSAVPTR